MNLKNLPISKVKIPTYFNSTQIDSFYPYLNPRDSIACGKTKCCIIPNSESYVLKIPFAKATDSFIPIPDYCAYESYIYRESKKYNLQHLFARTRFIGYINNYPIYIQPKVIPYSKSNKISNQAEIGKTAWYCLNNNVYMSQDDDLCQWQADVFKRYGGNTLSRLMYFLDEYEVNDLHADNIGYLNNKPILLDYSGYTSSYY